MQIGMLLYVIELSITSLLCSYEVIKRTKSKQTNKNLNY